MPALAGFTLTSAQIQAVRALGDEMAPQLDPIIASGSRQEMLEWTQRFMARARDVCTPDEAAHRSDAERIPRRLGARMESFACADGTVEAAAAIGRQLRADSAGAAAAVSIVKVQLSEVIDKLIDGTAAFSSDAKHAGYLHATDERLHVPLDANDSPGYPNINKPGITFSPHGKHSVYFAGTSDSVPFVLDGIPHPAETFGGTSNGSVVFSKDEAHYIYAARQPNGSWVMVADGKPGPSFEPSTSTAHAMERSA